MRLYSKITNDEIIAPEGADIVAQHNPALITVVEFAYWRRAVYLAGHRVYLRRT